jgi:Tol biopolymer transport system component
MLPIPPERANASRRPADQIGVYVVERNGDNDRRITDFYDLYEYFQVSMLRWSPNNRYLAFVLWGSIESAQSTVIYIYDINSDQYVFECPVYELTEEFVILYWSPDSRYLIYSSLIFSPVILIDTYTGVVIKLADKAIINGWSQKQFVISPNR